jgi:hypothetical protein
MLDLLAAHPELVANLKLPQVYVAGGGGLEGTAAMLGSFLRPVEPQAKTEASQGKTEESQGK